MFHIYYGGRCDRMEVGFTTTYAISNFIFGVSSLEENLFFVVNFVILTLILKF
jgi:hypothetical protein